MGKIGPSLAAMRPLNAFMAGAAVWVGSIVENGNVAGGDLISTLLLSVSAFLAVGGANLLNDIGDRELDRISHPDRPIPSGSLDPGTARKALLVNWGSAFLLSAAVCLLNSTALPVFFLLFALWLDIFYERVLKAGGAAGNVAVGLLTGALFIYGASPWKPGIVVLSISLLAFFSTFSRELVKDVQDMEGDAATRKTLPQRIGRTKTLYLAGSFMLLAVCTSPLPLLEIGIDPLYIAFIGSADVLFIISIFRSFKDPGTGHVLMKLGMATAVVGFLVSFIR
ncbi:MAG: geranylgeranylglycerol-phosphate geranylgeranyltransferase [Thermoplasmatota archaeon]